MSEEMTREEIQRFIQQCANDGRDKLETFDRLLEILGIVFPESNNENR